MKRMSLNETSMIRDRKLTYFCVNNLVVKGGWPWVIQQSSSKSLKNVKRLQISIRANQPHSLVDPIVSFNGSLCEVYRRQFSPR